MQNREVAKRCGLDEHQLSATFEEVYNLAPNQSRQAGRCTFTRSIGEQRVLVVITKNAGQGASR